MKEQEMNLMDVSWITASRMLRKIHSAGGHGDSIYRLHELSGIDGALIGARHSEGKRERGAETTIAPA